MGNHGLEGLSMRGAPFDASTALIVVDVQNDFADRAGSLYVSDGEEVVPVVNEMVQEALAAGGAVFYTQDWHPPSTPHFAKDGGIWPVHCVADSWGARLHPALLVEGPVIRKGVGGEDGYSGFMVRDPVTGHEDPTGLGEQLLNLRVSKVVVVGLATDYCVKATVLDAIAGGFEATVVRSAIRAVDLEEGDGDRGLDEMRSAGASVL